VIRRIAKRILPPGTRRHAWAKRHIEARLLKTGYRLPEPPADLSYADWVRDVEPATISPVEHYRYQPLISLVVPAYNTPDKYLHPLLDSIVAQTYPNWELILVECSPDPERAAAIHRAAGRDHRIRLLKLGQNLGIALNTNEGINAAKGEFIGFIDHDDTIAPSALNEVVRILQSRPEVDWFYSDEDKLSDDGSRRLPFLFKPDWSPDLFTAVNYVTHFTVVRTSLARKVGGIRAEFEGVQDFDFALRLLDHQPKIHHVPKVLYHWRYAEGSTAVHPSAKAKIEEAGVRALNQYLERNHINAVAVGVPNAPSNYHVKYATPGNPKASLVIPFRNKGDMTKVMVDSILNNTAYPNYEIILVNNQSDDPATLAYVQTLKNNRRIKLVDYNRPFNWSAVNNFGRLHASGEILVFLNNDMEVMAPEWLEELVGVALQPKVGAVGAMLLYPDKTIQHAGVVLGFFKVAGHVFRRLLPGNFTYFGLPEWPRNYLAVTGACLAVKADCFDKTGGFDESFLTAGSDVTFCLALYEAGYRNVYWPHAVLIHHENVSVGVYNQRADSRHDYEQSMKRYRQYIEAGDPYFNPNLDLLTQKAEQITLKGQS
jgi:O-antigen biosynthesis protein